VYLHPPKKTNAANEMQGEKSRSRLIKNAIQTEFFGGGRWERVVSPDGVVTDVTRLRPMRSFDDRNTSDGQGAIHRLRVL
jgi:hypothetical protein